MKGDRFGFRASQQKLNSKKRALLDDVIQHTLNFFKNRVFEAQGFINRTVVKWKPHQKGNWPILEKTGRGRASIRADREGKDSFNVYAGEEYMNYHNTGTTKMVKRPWLGRSETLTREILQKVDKFMSDILR